MEISRYLREHARTIKGKQQLIIDAFARALEVIPRQLCDNAGFDSTDILNKLRMRHARGDIWAGVDIQSEGIADNFEKFVWEPALVKSNATKAATEAATMIVSIDETIRAEQSQQPQSGPQMSRQQAQQVMRGMGRGRGMPRR
jgi:T-complex protein 1 subunit eta